MINIYLLGYVESGSYIYKVPLANKLKVKLLAGDKYLCTYVHIMKTTVKNLHKWIMTVWYSATNAICGTTSTAF